MRFVSSRFSLSVQPGYIVTLTCGMAAMHSEEVPEVKGFTEVRV